MSPTSRAALEVDCHPLSADRWQDLEMLFGPRGACGGCWCMYWRLPRVQFTAQKGEGTKQAFQYVVARGEIVGLLAYVKGQPVGWCAIAPRESYPVLARSRILKRVDEAPVWSVVCFFVSKGFRGQGLTTALLRAAVDYARQQGARVIEGYPWSQSCSRSHHVQIASMGRVDDLWREGGVMSEIQRIEDQLRRAFEGDAWHGPAVRELLGDVTAAKAAARPLPDAHSIWEIVLHIATWEGVVRRRLQGEAVADLPSEQDWPPVQETTETAWHKAMDDLDRGHRALREAIARSDEGRLAELVPGKEHSVYHMLHGIIQHDLYHAGQIAVLKKARN
jgi:GNAT superfamily N-acetyltransferase/uncharacterized damage-inducible protein DinB